MEPVENGSLPREAEEVVLPQLAGSSSLKRLLPFLGS